MAEHYGRPHTLSSCSCDSDQSRRETALYNSIGHAVRPGQSFNVWHGCNTIKPTAFTHGVAAQCTWLDPLKRLLVTCYYARHRTYSNGKQAAARMCVRHASVPYSTVGFCNDRARPAKVKRVPKPLRKPQLPNRFPLQIKSPRPRPHSQSQT